MKGWWVRKSAPKGPGQQRRWVSFLSYPTILWVCPEGTMSFFLTLCPEGTMSPEGAFFLFLTLQFYEFVPEGRWAPKGLGRRRAAASPYKYKKTTLCVNLSHAHNTYNEVEATHGQRGEPYTTLFVNLSHAYKPIQLINSPLKKRRYSQGSKFWPKGSNICPFFAYKSYYFIS